MGKEYDLALDELFEERSAREGIAKARRWYWRQLFGFVIRRRSLRRTYAPCSARDRVGDLKWPKELIPVESIRNVRPGFLIGDLSNAVRCHARQPGFAVLAVATLALGIGATSSIFSVVNGVLFRGLPLDSPHELVDIQVSSGIGGSTEFGFVSEPEFQDLAEQMRSFPQVAAYRGSEVTIGDSTLPRREPVMKASAELLPMLGVEPMLGRFFTLEEDMPGAEQFPDVGPVLVLGHSMWRSEFGGDPNVIGKSIVAADRSVTIVGVMPEGFEFPDASWRAWTSLQLNRADPWSRNSHYLSVLARLREGASIDDAQTEADLLAARSSSDFPEYYPDPGSQIRLRPFHENIVGPVTTPIFVLMGAVSFVLITACVNLANLLIARGEARKRELAVRHAIGATKLRLASQLLAENLLLAGFGGVAGILVAEVCVNLLVALAPAGLPRLNQITVDREVLLFSTAVTLGTGILFGLLPALRSASVSPAESLKESGRALAGRRVGNTVRRVLVVLQVMFAVVLTVGAGLMVRSVIEVYRVDPGFSTTNTVKFRLWPSSATYDTPESVVALYREILERIERLPGVVSASATSSSPLSELGWGRLSIVLDRGSVPDVGHAPAERVEHVTSGHFETLGIDLIRGRTFTNADDINSVPVVIVNESMASAHWPNEAPVGKRFRVHSRGAPWMEVVGVVGDVRHLAVKHKPSPTWYVPHAQAYETAFVSPLTMAVIVRTATDAATMLPTLLEAVRSGDRTLAINRVWTMEQVFARAVGNERFITLLLVVFGGVAMLTAAVGVYGVISYTASQRTHEIGIRMALGANAHKVLVGVVSEGLGLTAIGLCVGLAAAVVLSRSLSSMVFGIIPTDPTTYASVVGAFAAVAVLASLLPARKASRLSPMCALRNET
jgi:predicted permease